MTNSFTGPQRDAGTGPCGTGPTNPPTPKVGKSKTSFDITQFLWGTITVIYGALMLAAIAIDSDNTLDIVILFYVTLGFWTILKKINETEYRDWETVSQSRYKTSSKRLVTSQRQ